MEIYYDLDKIKNSQEKVATIGAFDGVHLGHFKIIERVLEEGKKKNSRTALITFDPDPKVFFSKKNVSNGILTTPEEKIDILNDSGLDELIFIPFDSYIANLSPDSFTREVIIEKINVSKLIVGYDHAIGKNRSGTLPVIKKLSKNYGFEIDVVLPFMVEKTIVSSTLIRNLVAEGKIEKANMFLSRNYSISGEVIKGDGRGSELGFKTANLNLKNCDKVILNNGIYAAMAEVGRELYQGMAYIGDKPTFECNETGLEIHIFNFNDNLYGENIRIEFFRKMRDDKKFENMDELKYQLQIDKENISEYLNKIQNGKTRTLERQLEKANYY